MTIPDGANRLVFSGDFINGLERWAFGLWFSGSPFDLSVGGPTGTPWTDWKTAFLAMMATNDHFLQLDSYVYSGGIATTHTSLSLSDTGAIAANALPFQCAAAITLRTALATRRGRGRIFLPYRGPSLSGTTGLGQATQINAAVDKLALWAQDLATAGTHLSVLSQTDGLMRTVTAVDADTVIDTQRRRRNALRAPRHSHVV